MKKTIYSCLIALFVAGSSTLVSCLGDLDLKPIDKNLIQDSDFKSHHEYYTQFLAKVYAGLAVSGQEGPAGKPDIEGFDEGMAHISGHTGIFRNCRPTKPYYVPT